jgi:undecaprenyl-diphosphatase
MPPSLQSFDLWLFHALTPWHAGWLDALMSVISIVGTGSTIWIVLGIFALTRPRHRAAGFRLLLTLLLCFITIDLVLKPLVARERPVPTRSFDSALIQPIAPRTLSFPSGHTAAAFASAIALSRMWPQAQAAWWLAAVAMGYSRIYLGHHYPLDVAGGAIVGVLIALWVHGGRHPATCTRGFTPPPGAVIRP